MPKEISILELDDGKGGIVEIPVLEGDTPEVLTSVLQKNGFDATKYQNEIGQALTQKPDSNQKVTSLKADLDYFTNLLLDTTDKRQADLLSKKVSAIETQLKSLEPKEPDAPPSLYEKTDIKQILSQILAAGEASTNVDNIMDAKSKTNTGPLYSRIFDASLPQFDPETNQAKPTDSSIDILISSLFGKKTRNIRALDQSLKALSDYLTSTSGKTITSGEAGLQFPKFPTIYEDDEQFNEVAGRSKEMMQKFIMNRINFLKSVGAPEDQVNKIIPSNGAIDKNALMSLIKQIEEKEKTKEQ